MSIKRNRYFTTTHSAMPLKGTFNPQSNVAANMLSLFLLSIRRINELLNPKRTRSFAVVPVRVENREF